MLSPRPIFENLQQLFFFELDHDFVGGYTDLVLHVVLSLDVEIRRAKDHLRNYNVLGLCLLRVPVDLLSDSHQVNQRDGLAEDHEYEHRVYIEKSAIGVNSTVKQHARYRHAKEGRAELCEALTVQSLALEVGKHQR